MKESKMEDAQVLDLLELRRTLRPRADALKPIVASETRLYVRKPGAGGAQASDLERLRELEADFARLKRMFSYLSMEHNEMKELIARKLRD